MKGRPGGPGMVAVCEVILFNGGAGIEWYEFEGITSACWGYMLGLRMLRSSFVASDAPGFVYA